MKDLETIIDLIQVIADQRKESVNKIFQNSGVGKDFIADMRKGKIPSAKKFSDLADYLDVSVDYLLGRTDKPEINK